MNNFNKTTLNEVRAKLNAVLASSGIDNVDLQVGNISYSASEATIKISAKIRGAVTRSESLLKYEMSRFGMNETNRDGDKLVEYKTRNRKYPWIYICGKSGKRFKCSQQQAQLKFM